MPCSGGDGGGVGSIAIEVCVVVQGRRDPACNMAKEISSQHTATPANTRKFIGFQ